MEFLDTYTMIITNRYSGEKMKVRICVEQLDDEFATNEALSDIQNDFLWETFDFEFEKGDPVELNDDLINAYGDVEVLAK